MGYGGNTREYKLVEDYKSKKKTFKDTFDLKKINTGECVLIKEDIEGQVVVKESGSNIVITAYDTQEVTYRKVSTTISAEKETTGKNKGKYKVTTVTYNATYNESGEVSGFDEGTEKTTYSKKAGTGEAEIVYETLNAKNKVIASTTEDVTGENKTIVNTAKVLGTVTYKNGQDFDENVILETDVFGSDLFLNRYDPQKSGKKYTGTWLQEDATSTSANETFNLGVNREEFNPDVINYDMADKHGKDTVVLAKDSRVDLEMTNDGGLIKTFIKSGNNVTMSLGKSSDYDGNPLYKKVEMIVVKTGSDKYTVTTNVYVWDEYLNEGDGGYKLESTDVDDTWNHESIVLVGNQMKKDYGVDFKVGTNTYYRDGDYFLYQGGEESLAKITFKNYLKLAQDGVTLNGDSFKDILENAEGVGILGNASATKKQKLTGTFLREQFYGGANNDTITTGDDYDTVYLSKGKDTVTVNGSGLKTVDYVRPDGFAWVIQPLSLQKA